MTSGSIKSQLLLIWEAATSPALLLVILGISCIVKVATAWIDEIPMLKAVHAELEIIDSLIRYADIFALLSLVGLGTFILVLEAIAKAEAKYHSIIITMRAKGDERYQQKLDYKHARNVKKLEHKHELERLVMDQAARRRINQSLAPQPKFPMRINPDSTSSHVVSIRAKVQPPDS